MRSLATVSSWPVSAAACGVLVLDPSGSGSVSAGGPGPVRVAGTVGELETPFPWASVTKLCTALAVLVAVEERTVSLGDPAGPSGSTVAHLLAHASGLSPDGDLVLAEPGRRRIYSNAGFEVLATAVGLRAGIPFDVYLQEAVLDPLGMAGSKLPSGGSAATGMFGPVRDLMALGRELLAPTVIGAETLASATAVCFPGLAGVLPGFGRQDPCDWGLGFEIRDSKHPHWTGGLCSPRTFGHFGQAGGFLWVDPYAGVACAALSDRSFGPWAAAAWPVLADGILSELGRAPGGLSR
jgi:CubicO group peptidase (beta-lactamase class C family)